MFILDDLLFRPFVGIIDVLHSLAINELCDLDALENQMLYELGERPEKEYRRRKEKLGGRDRDRSRGSRAVLERLRRGEI